LVTAARQLDGVAVPLHTAAMAVNQASVCVVMQVQQQRVLFKLPRMLL